MNSNGGENMDDEVIYITRYPRDYQETIDYCIKEYTNKCVICQSQVDIHITNILSEEIYPELTHETWNNIPLCNCCRKKLEHLNNNDNNGFKNILTLIHDEYKKKINWIKQ